MALGRWSKAFWGPSNNLDDRASKVRQAIVEVRSVSEELLSKNIDMIKQLNIGQFLPISSAHILTCSMLVQAKEIEGWFPLREAFY